MNGCLNVLWHFPFLGFLIAIGYALWGVVLCCTVILLPLGLGYLQIARFTLTPFSSALVSKKDLELIRPQERSEAMKIYSTIIFVLFIPFGVIAAGLACFQILYCFLSIVGIPCGIVWVKLLPSLFNPVDKVCVPKSVADEIGRIKAGNTVARFRGTEPAAGVAASAVAGPVAAAEPEWERPAMPEVRAYDEAKLREIIAEAEMYRAELVEQCRQELEIRCKGEALMPRVREYDDAKLREILSNPQMYSEELSYCAQREDAEHRRVVEERQAREAEQVRLEREQAAKAEAERRAAAWKKQRPYYFAAIAVAVLVLAGVYWHGRVEERQRLEQQRIAQEERLQAERIAEQRREENERKAAEEQRRLAAEKKAAAQKAAEERRIAAEKQAAEEQRCRAERLERNSKGVYRIGDVWGDGQGVVCSVDESGRSGVVVSVAEERMTGTAAQKSVPGWRLPSEKELVLIFRHRQEIDRSLRECGHAALANDYYWGDVAAPGYLWRISMNDGRVEKRLLGKKLVNGKYVEEECLVRRVRSF